MSKSKHTQKGAPWTDSEKPKPPKKESPLDGHRAKPDLKEIREKLKEWEKPFRKL